MHVHARRAARTAALAALLVATAAVPSVGRAQAPAAADSLPLARGQWALQLTGGTSLVSLGALRFTSPHTAWLLDVSASAIRSTVRYDSTSGTVYPGLPGSGRAGQLGLRLGRRGYRALGRSVASFATLGVSARYSASHQDLSGSDDRSRVAAGGVFGDLGATYFVTPHLGLGASVTLAAEYSRMHNEGYGPTMRSSAVSAELQRPAALVTLFF